jgi:toxin-antitoxin system, antitoxin component, xre family|nr:MAG TPA: repressor [Caudoviricetes sp.]
MSSIVSRIKEFIDQKGVSVRKFEEKVGFSNGAFASQYKNNGSIGSDKIENILHSYPEINVIWLLTGKGDMLKPRVEDIKNMSKEEQIKALKQIASGEFYKKPNIVPFYENVATIGGTQQSADLSPVTAPTAYIDLGSMYPGANAAIRHFGESMSEYPSGCILAIKKINNLKSIVWGQNYVVETDEIRVTKKLQTCKDDKNCIMAYSTNPSTHPDGQLIYEPFPIEKEDIRSIFHVEGYLVQEQNSAPVIFRLPNGEVEWIDQ